MANDGYSGDNAANTEEDEHKKRKERKKTTTENARVTVDPEHRDKRAAKYNSQRPRNSECPRK